MDNRSKNKDLGFKAALNGIWQATKKENNLKIHWIALVFVLITGWFLKFEKADWLAVLLISALVLSCEMINTAIEKIMDVIHPEYDEKVKFIKDVSAGAVLISVLIAVLIFGVIVWDKIN